jgi:hypothetical protein
LSGSLVSHLIEDVEILVREADLSAECREGITQANTRVWLDRDC